MYKKNCRFPLFGFLLIVAAATFAQPPRFTQLQRTVIEGRLRQYADQNTEREATIKRLFEEAGCRGDRLTEQSVDNSDAPNIVCTLPGTGDDVILIGAHFDHVQKGEGVADNWSGASLLPSLYQSLSSTPRRHTYVFVSFTDEEKGFVGSTFYADGLTEDEVSHIRGMIDIDTLGLGPTEVWVNNSDPELVKQIDVVASDMKLPIGEMNVDGIGDSDGKPFKQRNIPIITLHSVTKQNLNILHSYRDNLAAMNLADYYDSYTLISAYLASLDSDWDGERTKNGKRQRIDGRGMKY
jgi:aminopeptidase-like protein